MRLALISNPGPKALKSDALPSADSSMVAFLFCFLKFTCSYVRFSVVS